MFDDGPEYLNLREFVAGEPNPVHAAAILTADQAIALARRNVESIKRQRAAGLLPARWTQNVVGTASLVPSRSTKH